VTERQENLDSRSGQSLSGEGYHIIALVQPNKNDEVE